MNILFFILIIITIGWGQDVRANDPNINVMDYQSPAVKAVIEKVINYKNGKAVRLYKIPDKAVVNAFSDSTDYQENRLDDDGVSHQSNTQSMTQYMNQKDIMSSVLEQYKQKLISMLDKKFHLRADSISFGHTKESNKLVVSVRAGEAQIHYLFNAPAPPAQIVKSKAFDSDKKRKDKKSRGPASISDGEMPPIVYKFFLSNKKMLSR